MIFLKKIENSYKCIAEGPTFLSFFVSEFVFFFEYE